MAVEIGKAAPDFRLQSSGGRERTLQDFHGRWVVLYFYPRDNTPGCTTEACAFRDNSAVLAEKRAVVLGVSCDSLKSHAGFIAKFNLPFELLSDPDHAVAEVYGVWKEKSMYGKKVMGIERSTFLVDPEGKLRREWRKVKVDGHAIEVLNALEELGA